jgi:hypothetical protein
VFCSRLRGRRRANFSICKITLFHKGFCDVNSYAVGLHRRAAVAAHALAIALPRCARDTESPTKKILEMDARERFGWRIPIRIARIAPSDSL